MQICLLNLQDLLILCLFVAFLSDINSFCVFQGRDCPSCFGAQSTQIISSSQCQTQKVNNKDNTQTPHRKALGQK